MGSEARVRVAFGAMLALVTLSFAQVFAEGPYSGPALLGILLAGAVAVAGRRLGAGTALTAGASLVLLVSYLVLVFQARNSFYGLASPDALRGLWRAVARAYEHSRVDYAPVPVRAGYVIMVVTALWFSAGWGEIATFRWRQPLLAALPPTVLFCLMITVGTGTGTSLLVILYLIALFSYWAVQSADELGAWGRAVGAWGTGTRPRPGGAFARVARRMALSSLISAVFIPLALPSLGAGLIPWRSGLGDAAGTGSPVRGAGAGSIDPFVQIAPSLLSQSSAVLFTVRAERADYWRLLSLTTYDGERWMPSPEPRIPSTTGSVPSPDASDGSLRTFFHQTIEIEELRGSFLPASNIPVVVDLPDTAADRLRIAPDTADLALEGGIGGPFSYSVDSAVTNMTYRDLRRAQIGDPGPQYTRVPDLDPQVLALIQGWTAAAESPGAKLMALQEHLRGFEYRLPTVKEVAAARVGGSAEYLTRFLTEIRAGYCQQFSTAFALAARALGYPARVSVGFLPGSADVASEVFTVRGTDAHAWPEVFFQGWGWVAFEPTPRSEAAIPDYTLSPILAAANFQRPDAEIFDPRGGRGLDVRTLTDPGLAGVEGVGPIDGRRGNDRGRLLYSAWVKAFNRLALVAAILVGIVLVLVPAYTIGRIIRRSRRASTPAEIAGAAFAQFEEGAAILGLPRTTSESAREYARRVAKARSVAAGPALRLAAIADAGRYSATGPRSGEALEARRLAARLIRGLWATASWWERATGLLSPSNLVRR